MNQSSSIQNLATALAKAQAEMPVAVFDASNPFLKSKYASLGAVIQSSRPILAKYDLSLIQFPISQPAIPPAVDLVGIESILSHASGEFISERILIPLVEEKGKSRVQTAGSVLTYLRRYSWASILGMYSDEDSDGGSATCQSSSNLPVGTAASPHGPSAPAKSFSPKPAATLPPPPAQRK